MSNIIGISTGKMIRTASSSSAQRTGLERITETYIFKKSEESTFRNLIVNGETYDTITPFIQGGVDAGKNYTWMSVENFDFSDMAGGITEVTISYVGMRLTASQIPVGIVPLYTSIFQNTLLPEGLHRMNSVNSWLENPFSQTVQFVSFSNTQNIQTLLNLFGTRKPMPTTVAKVGMIPSAKPPYRQEFGEDTTVVFYGLTSQGLYYEKYGQFVVANVTFNDEWEVQVA